MCGILAIFGIKGKYQFVRQYAIKLSRRLKHRGPDCSNLMLFEREPNVWDILCHERLNIIDASENGRQPFIHEHPENKNKHLCWVHNGEIYNVDEIK